MANTNLPEIEAQLIAKKIEIRRQAKEVLNSQRSAHRYFVAAMIFIGCVLAQYSTPLSNHSFIASGLWAGVVVGVIALCAELHIVQRKIQAIATLIDNGD